MIASLRPLTVTLLIACLAACGARSGSARPKPMERWETAEEWVLATSERCVTGPFEIEVPDREIEFGRRFTVEIFGERGLPMDSQFAYASGRSSSGWGWSEEGLGENLGDHSACRLDAEEATLDPSVARDPGDGRERDGAPGGPGGEGAPGAPVSAPEPEVVAPSLETYRGALPRRVQRAGIAWFPQGSPTSRALDDIRSTFYSSGGHDGFRFRFWFHRPVDMRGAVIRIRDQILVPTIDVERYRATFADRVAEVEGRLREFEVVRSDEPRAAAHAAARGKIPPPPKDEVEPTAPGSNVEWIPGYWRYHEELGDFLWIAGTFVVRARDDAAPATDEGPEMVGDASIDEERVVAVDERVPPQPAPRRETIPAPPAIAGAQWIPGYWELRGSSWAWVEGRWQVPRASGARFRPPSIEVRGSVKVYLPGGWTSRARR
jgi:hypothetical protein